MQLLHHAIQLEETQPVRLVCEWKHPKGDKTKGEGQDEPVRGRRRGRTGANHIKKGS